LSIVPKYRTLYGFAGIVRLSHFVSFSAYTARLSLIVLLNESSRIGRPTRTARSVRGRLDRTGYLLSSADVIASPETGLCYRSERLLGEGGFGQVYLARRVDRSSIVPETVCIKVKLAGKRATALD